MANPSWYTDNLSRAFPFIAGSVDVGAASTVEGLPNAIVVDCGFITGLNSGYVPGTHSIWLDSVTRLGSEFIFEFRSDAPGLFQRPLQFIRHMSDPKFITEFVEDTHSYFQPFVSQSVTDPDPVTQCFFLGQSGTFIAPRSGRLHFYFNDDAFISNGGFYTLVFDDVTYTVLASRSGAVGPLVHKGGSYAYSSGGIVTFNPDWRQTPEATPDGTGTYTHRELAGTRFVCPGAPKWSLVATLTDNAFGASDSIQHVSDSLSCQFDALWSGYLVTGDMAALSVLLPADGALTRTNGGIVEPSLVQSIEGAYVSSLNIGNQDRTRVTSAAGCNEIEWPYPVGPNKLFTAATCLRGHIRIYSGFNAAFRQESFDNSIVATAAVGAGEGEPCESVPLFPGEIPPQNSELLEGGPGCNDVIRTVNGVGGQFSFLRAGQGVTITTSPSTHTIVIDVNMTGLAICFGGQFSEISETV